MFSDLQPSLPFEPHERRRAPIRRRVFRLRLEPFEDGSYLFRARSFTRRNGRAYRVRVNPESGLVWCSCRDFQYRKGPRHPDFWHGPWCKHLERAIRTVRKVRRDAFMA